MQLQGKSIIVTGAAQGLGRKMAEMLVERGARVALADSDERPLREAERGCRDALSIPAGGACRGYVADMREEAEVTELFQRVREDFGPLDALVNNAGITRDALLVEGGEGLVAARMSLDDFRQVVAVDLEGVFLCGREAATHMVRDRRGGVILNVSSISRCGNVGQTAYSAAKAGVAAMTVVWAKELARHGIRVAAIAPGFSDTRMVAAIPETIRARLVAAIPAGRLARPDEIAEAAVFVLGNDYFNGRVLEIDGGMRL
ncbi:SDR family oxidoreductase [Aureimonas sp. AU4]|uniref:SDR family oxidoreductase n=1 Tax=Aureimonas sp. AU4 TaxID=1638163 RepID=UPI000784BE60|nr:SDR family oxidoreductase [Aureimonas sp. AU4]